MNAPFKGFVLPFYIFIYRSPDYRQVPRKPRLACPVKYEVYLTGVGGDESAQFKK